MSLDGGTVFVLLSEIRKNLGKVNAFMNEEKDFVEFDIIQIFAAVLHRWWVIALCAIICAGMMFGYTSMFVTPMYTSNILMYVNNSSSVSLGGQSIGISAGDISAAQTLVDSYCIILESRLTLEEVIKEADLDMSYEQLKGAISAQAVNGTEIFSVQVTDPNPAQACKIANTIATVLPEKIPNVVEGSSVKTVDFAVVPKSPSAPDIGKNTVLGFLVGFVVSALVVALVDMFNDTLYSEEWLAKSFDEKIPILSVIPDANEQASSKYGYGKRHYGYYYTSSSQKGSGK